MADIQTCVCGKTFRSEAGRCAICDMHHRQGETVFAVYVENQYQPLTMRHYTQLIAAAKAVPQQRPCEICTTPFVVNLKAPFRRTCSKRCKDIRVSTREASGGIPSEKFCTGLNKSVSPRQAA